MVAPICFLPAAVLIANYQGNVLHLANDINPTARPIVTMPHAVPTIPNEKVRAMILYEVLIVKSEHFGTVDVRSNLQFERHPIRRAEFAADTAFQQHFYRLSGFRDKSICASDGGGRPYLHLEVHQFHSWRVSSTNSSSVYLLLNARWQDHRKFLRYCTHRLVWPLCPGTQVYFRSYSELTSF